MPPIFSRGSGVHHGPIPDDVHNDLLKRAPVSSVQTMTQTDPITHRLASNAQASTSNCEFHQSNTHVDCESDNSDDERKGVCVAELVWPSEAIPYSCSSLKPIQKIRQEEARFTFDVSKCDRIFDELHRNGNINCLMSYRRLRS